MGLNNETLISVNWRTRVVAEMTLDGRQVRKLVREEGMFPSKTVLIRSASLPTRTWWSP